MAGALSLALGHPLLGWQAPCRFVCVRRLGCLLDTLLLASGTPILLLPEGGTLEKIEHAVCGWMVAGALRES